MNLFISLRFALEGLFRNLFRTLLTMIGLVIGVFAVVSLVSLGNGAKLYVVNEFQGLGTNLIMVQPGKAEKKGMMGPPVGSSERKMTLADVEAIERKARTLDSVSGITIGSTSIEYEENLASATIFGVNEQFDRILNFTLKQGSFFTRDEDSYGRRFVVLGTELSKSLFGSSYPIGRVLRINESNFKVIGVLTPMGNKLGLDMDQIAMIPTKSSLKLFNEDKLFGIRARASTKSSVQDAVNEITTIFRERRNGKDDVTILTQQAMISSLDSILGVLSYVIAGIAAISMLVGGIGIMNMMLVNVTERIQEIGIRRAVGARKIDILQQFLCESLLLSVVGGTIGILLSYALSSLVSLIYPIVDLNPPPWIVLCSMLLSLLVGLLFGVIPAIKASNIDTLEALRHE
jgi:putative ABC transport system permease protein